MRVEECGNMKWRNGRKDAIQRRMFLPIWRRENGGEMRSNIVGELVINGGGYGGGCR